MLTREIQTVLGHMLVPGEPEERSRRSEECVREVLDTQIYSYPRTQLERSGVNVTTLLDIGSNVGAFVRFASFWWPTLERAWCYDPNVSACELAAINAHSGTINCNIIPSAVTIDPFPLFHEEMDWGGSRTHGQNKGVRVTAVHPRDLPAADVLKVDCEGPEMEVLSHYPHLAGVKFVCLEYHETRFRKSIMSILGAAGFVMKRGNPNVVEVDTQHWVRPQ